MTHEELSAQEASLDKAIGFLEKAENENDLDGNIFALIDMGKAWATVAEALTLHNRSVAAAAVAEAAVSFVSSPTPEAYAYLNATVEQYSENR